MRVHPRYDSLWIAPAFLDYVHEPLTSKAVLAAEKQLGVTLPRMYIAMLSEQNGGYLRGAIAESVSNTLFGIGEKFPSITGDSAPWRTRGRGAEWAPDGAERLIPFDGDGHWHMCFDYRARGPHEEPSVSFVDSEVHRAQEVAPSFDAYLAAIIDETADRALRLRAPLAASVVARRIGSQLAVEAPTVDRFSHGYDTWRLALEGMYQWCWVHPNVVSRGFRRENKRVIVTDETALRIPEDAECHTIVSCTDESRASVERAIEALGLS